MAQAIGHPRFSRIWGPGRRISQEGHRGRNYLCTAQLRTADRCCPRTGSSGGRRCDGQQQQPAFGPYGGSPTNHRIRQRACRRGRAAGGCRNTGCGYLAFANRGTGQRPRCGRNRRTRTGTVSGDEKVQHARPDAWACMLVGRGPGDRRSDWTMPLRHHSSAALYRCFMIRNPLGWT